MNDIDLSFLDGQTIDTNAPDTPILPDEGLHNCYVSKITLKPTKKGNGAYLELELTLDNKMRVWEIFVLKHENVKTVKIARDKFKKALKALGVDGVFDVNKYRELVDRMCKVKLVHDEYQGRKQAKVAEWVVEKKEDDFKNF